jgi:hypothetical protein
VLANAAKAFPKVEYETHNAASDTPNAASEVHYAASESHNAASDPSNVASDPHNAASNSHNAASDSHNAALWFNNTAADLPFPPHGLHYSGTRPPNAAGGRSYGATLRRDGTRSGQSLAIAPMKVAPI